MVLDSVVERVASEVGRRCTAEQRTVGADLLPLRIAYDDVEVPADRFAELVAARTSDRLILVGVAGAGKTTIVTGLVLALDARGTGPVPLYLPLSTWRPGRSLFDWAADTLGVVSAAELHDVSARRGLLWVLDGLGEARLPSPADVLKALHRDLGEADGVVLACRPEAYRDVLTVGDPSPGLALVKVQPLRAADVAAWLAASERAGWGAAVAELEMHPTGVLAQALATPEHVQLAVAAYTHGGDPAELATVDGSAIEACLLDRFEARVDPSGDQRARLVFLARHLHRLGTRDLDWWRLAAAVPEAVRGFTVQLGSAFLLGAALGLAIGAAAGFWFGLGFGIAFGVQGWPSGGRGGGVAWRATIVATFALLLSEVYHPVAGVAVAVLVGWLAWGGYGRTMGLGIGLATLAASALAAVVDNSASWAVGVGVFLAFTTGMVFWWVFCEARIRPSRMLTRPPRAMQSFLGRFGAGFGASLFGTVVIALTGRAGIAVAVSLGVACGLAAGLTVWLDAPGRTYNNGPLATLRQDRAAALTAGLASGVLIGTGVLVALRLFVGLSQAAGRDTAAAARIGTVAGIGAGLAITLSRSWGGFVLARLWLGLAGPIPRQTMTYLDQLHVAGVLVPSGGAYRFRFRTHEERLRGDVT